MKEEEKPTRTFTLCDKENNQYVINEFKTTAIFNQKDFTQKPHYITNITYSTNNNEYVELDKDKNIYYLEINNTKIKLYDCVT